jgi:hypothetical protein
MKTKELKNLIERVQLYEACGVFKNWYFNPTVVDAKLELEQLILNGVSQRSKLLLDYTKQLKKQGTLTSGQDEGKLVKKFLSNNCG